MRFLFAGIAVLAAAVVLPAVVRADVTIATGGPIPGTSSNFQLVGHDPLFNRGMNAAIAVDDNSGFVYVGNRTDGPASKHPHPGILVVDASDPSNPHVVNEIGAPIVGLSGETTRELRVWPQKHLLIVMTFACSSTLHACATVNLNPRFLFFDITDPANPTLLLSYVPRQQNNSIRIPHEMFLWVDPKNPSGRALLYSTFPSTSTTTSQANVIVYDISNVRSGTNPPIVAQGNWDNQFESGGSDTAFQGQLYVHSLSVTADGTMTNLAHERGNYLALDTTPLATGGTTGVLNLNSRLITPPANRPKWGVGNICVAQQLCAIGHSEVQVPGRQIDVNTDEIYGTYAFPWMGCPWGWMRTISQTDLTHPVIVGEYKLAIDTCPAPDDATEQFTSYSAHNPTVTRHIAFITWHSGGLQAVDISDPAHLTQAGWYTPVPLDTVNVEDPALNGGDSKVTFWSYPVIHNGLIYAIDIRNGLYILRYTGPHHDEVDNIHFLEGNSNVGDDVALSEPSTTATLSPDETAGFYSNPTATLSAETGPAGLDRSEYRLDGGAWTTYAAPFQVTGDGHRVLDFRSTDKAGNAEPTETLAFDVDGTPPTTAATLSPPATSGWYVNPTVTLSADDGAGSGVATTESRLDGGSWTPYAAPFQVTGQGAHTLDFRSTDQTGNVEAFKTLGFVVDSAAPTTTASLSPSTPGGSNGWYLGPVEVTLSAADGALGSGVASTVYSVDGGASTAYTGSFTISADGSHTVQFSSTDVAGNAEDAHSVTVDVDQNDPVTTATLAPGIHNGWYATPTVTLAAVDGSGSGVARIDYSLDGGAWGLYGGVLHITTNGNHMVQYRATDNAGRVEAVRLTAFRVDAVNPTVTITTPPDGAVYPLDKVVTAKYKCTDALSGLDTCLGTVVDGGGVATGTLGSKTFTVTGTDLAGNSTALTVRYRVVFAWNGFFAPVANTADGQLNLVHAGDLIKVGFGLDGDRGLGVLAAGSPGSTPIPCPAWPPRTVPAAGAGATEGLSFGVASGHYTLGWQTSAGWAGTCRRFDLALGDGTPSHTADFMFFS